MYSFTNEFVSFRFFVCGTTERCNKLLCIYMKYIVRKKWQSIMSTKKNIINTRANLIRMKASTLCLTLRKIRKPNEIETGEPTDDYETMTNSNKNIARYWYARECGLSHCMCGLVMLYGHGMVRVYACALAHCSYFILD